MAKIKLFTILIIIIVFGITFDLNNKIETKYNVDINTIDTINVNLDNAIVEIKATAEPQTAVEVVQTKLGNENRDIYFKQEDNVLEINQYDKNTSMSIFKGFASDKITIYVPETKIIDTLNYNVDTGKLNISGSTINNINTTSKDIILNLSDGHFENINVNSVIGNVYLNKAVGEKLYLNIEKGGVEIENSRITKGDIVNLTDSTILLDSLITGALNVGGLNNDVILNLNKEKNYDVMTSQLIESIGFTKSDGGYKYQGSTEQETNKMNFNNNNIKSISLE